MVLISKCRRFWLVIALGLFCGISSQHFLYGQSQDLPSALQISEEVDLTQERQVYLRFLSASAALEFGFSSIAEDVFSDLLRQDSHVSLEIRVSLLENLILAQLNLGEVVHANDNYDSLVQLTGKLVPYLKLLILYHQENSYEEIGELIESTDWSSGDITEKAWVDLIRGFWLMHQDQFQQGRVFVDQALSQSSGDFQRAWMEMLIWREEILSGQASPSLAISLKAQVQNAVNPLVASQLTQEYAIALAALDRDDEAIQVVERQLSELGNDLREQKDRLLMLIAMLSGPRSGKAQYAIQEILTKGKSERIRSLAFYYWIPSLDFTLSSNKDLLFQLSGRGESDPLGDKLLYVYALSEFYDGAFDESRQHIEAVLDSTKDLYLQQSALRVLVGVCWSQDPPQYRLAAQHLQRLRDLTAVDSESDQLTLLIADSYFLNGDYENALPFYEEVKNSEFLSEVSGDILYKITTCFLSLGNLDGARPVLDEFQQSKSITHELVWGSEWNFNLQLIDRNQSDMAVERMQSMRNKFQQSVLTENWEFSASMRLAWLLGYLYYQNQSYDDCVGLCENVLGEFDLYPDAQQERLVMVADELNILFARSLFALEENERALALLHQIRNEANAESAATTFMIESRYYWSVGDSTNAMRALIRLADLYPNSRYAPVALYEAAMNAESNRSEVSDQEAIALYERISNDFPNHPLRFVSRLRQGDLLRKSNQFALAIPFYESLLTEFEGDDRLYMVQMALGESYLALGSTRLDYINESIRILERVYDLNNLPLEVRLEAGTKAAVGLIRVDRVYRAQEILWRVISLVETEPEASHLLGATGRYWLARSALMLSEQLDERGHVQEKKRLIDMAERMNLPGLNLLKN